MDHDRVQCLHCGDWYFRLSQSAKYWCPLCREPEDFYPVQKPDRSSSSRPPNPSRTMPESISVSLTLDNLSFLQKLVSTDKGSELIATLHQYNRLVSSRQLPQGFDLNTILQLLSDLLPLLDNGLTIDVLLSVIRRVLDSFNLSNELFDLILQIISLFIELSS